MSNIFLKSPGGSGTRYLYSVFGKENLCGGRKWFNPHSRFDPNLPDDAQIFYVMAHPLNILLSFEKEGFFKDPNMRIIENMQGDKNSWVHYGVDSLEKYADVGVNMFDFQDHAKRAFTRVNTGLLIYEELKETIHRIRLPQIEPKPFVQRRSDYTKADPELIRKLEKIHKSDIEFYFELKKMSVL